MILDNNKYYRQYFSGIQWTPLDWDWTLKSGLGFVPANLAWQNWHWNPLESSGVQWSPYGLCGGG